MMSKGNRWSCTIELQFRFDEQGNKLNRTETVKFGNKITDPSQVEERLKRAQHAILKYSRDPSSFLTGPIPEETPTIFSENVISMKIEGPNEIDLSFYDLPGTFRISSWFLPSDVK
jgi:hypothetical protein